MIQVNVYRCLVDIRSGELISVAKHNTTWIDSPEVKFNTTPVCSEYRHTYETKTFDTGEKLAWYPRLTSDSKQEIVVYGDSIVTAALKAKRAWIVFRD